MSLYFLGRIILGAYFVYSGVLHFKDEKKLTLYLKSKKIPKLIYHKYIILITGGILILGGLGIFLNMAVSKSAILILLFLIPTNILMHSFWKDKDTFDKNNNRVTFLKNLALIGALLTLI